MPALLRTHAIPVKLLHMCNRAVDCTTNPSLVYKAVQQPEYQRFLSDALAAKSKGVIDTARPFAGAFPQTVSGALTGCECAGAQQPGHQRLLSIHCSSAAVSALRSVTKR